MVLIGLQFAILMAYVTDSTGWSVGGVTALPSLQAVSLLSYLCSPHLFKEEPTSHTSFDIDLEELSGDATSKSMSKPSHRPTSFSVVERARRKLPGASTTGREKLKRGWKVFSRPVGGRGWDLALVETGKASRGADLTGRRVFSESEGT
jgi:hypothetical protein